MIFSCLSQNPIEMERKRKNETGSDTEKRNLRDPARKGKRDQTNSIKESTNSLKLTQTRPER